MNKKIIVFLSLFLTTGLFAQDDGSIELLTGNTEYGVSANEQGYPINTWYHDVKHQSLYHASDLGNAGILSGSIITGIKFKVNETPGRDIDSLRIAYTWTSNTTLSSFDTTTVAYGPTNYTISSFLPNNWVQFDFSSPITWDGVSNLIIEYSHDNNSYITGGGLFMRDVGQNRGHRGWTDSGAGHYPFNTNMAQSQDSKVASIRLLIQEAGVQPPSALSATPSYQQVDLSWTASTSDSIANYLIYRGTGSGNASKIDSVSAIVTTYSDSGLTNGTTYYYAVKTKQQDGDLSSMSTPAAAVPSVETPANLSASAGSQQVTLTWDAPSGSGVGKTMIYRGTSSSNATLVDSTSDGTTVIKTNTGLSNGVTYYFVIKFKGNDNSLGSFSSIVSAMPDYTGPAWYVSPTGNNTSGDGSQSGPFSTIQFAIDKASINDTIKLKPGTYTGYGNYDINPQKDLVLLGVGGADSVTIDVNASLNNRHYGFNISSFTYSTLKIKGITIINAMSNDGYGGAIRIDNAGTVEVENCIIGPGNRAISGAGIYITNTDVTISGTVIKGNTANMTSGIFSSNIYGVGLHITNNNTNTVTVKNSIIRGNTGTASGSQNDMYGGGFYASGQSSTVNFINTIIFNNELTRDGANGWWSRGGAGAIYNGAQVYFVHTNILKNNSTNTSSAADGRAGALWFDTNNNSTAYFLNSIVWGNTASTTNSDEQMFAGDNTPSVTMNYSATQVYQSGAGNLNEDPEFTDEDNNVFTLSLRSGLLGAGAAANQGLYPGDDLITSTDLVGNARPGSGGGNPDMGALENALSVSPVPDAPTGLTATAGDGEITLSWTANSETDIAKYGIYYGTSTAPSVKEQEVSSGTTVTITGLSNNVTYYFRISAINSGSYESGFSAEVTGAPQFSGSTIYVDGSATGSEDGSSGSPYHTIQDAISASATTDGKRILVLAGTYTYESSAITYSFSFNDNYGYQSGTFTVSGASVASLTFTHSNTNDFPGSTWTIENTSYFNNTSNYQINATSESNTTFEFSNSMVHLSGNSGTISDGWSQNVWQSSSASEAVLDLKGKNIVLEAVSGSDSTFINGGGQYTALSLDASINEYSGYSNSTKFIGFTFTNGDDAEPLIHIEGPNDLSSTLNWAPTFENCRFTNTTIDDVDPNDNNLHGVIEIKNAEPVFDGCEFRNLNTSINQDLLFGGGFDIAGPIRMKGTESSTDTAAFRPVFKNCVIAENSLVDTYSNTWNSYNFKGGAIYVGFGALPLFKDTRIDSNKIDIGDGLSNWSHHNAYGGGIYIDNYMSRGEAIKFINTSISYNEIKGEAVYGGGIFAKFPSLEFTNCLMVGNSLDATYANSDDGWIETVGGAIRWTTDLSIYVPSNLSEDPELLVVNSTIVGNSITPTSYDVAGAGGAGICRENTNNHDVIIFNSIITNNTISNVDDQTRINLATNYGQWSDNNSLIDFSIIEYFSDSGLEEDNLMDIDPNFTSSSDYSLAASSVAIGAGTTSYEGINAPAFDYNNDFRPNPSGSNPDLGAFENSLSTTPYPAKPQNLTVSAEGDSTVTLSWTANSEDDLSEYKIYYGTSTASTLLDSVSGTPSYTATGLDNYTTYYFAVSSEDLDGYESAKSNEVSGTPKWFGPNWYVDEDNGYSQSQGDGSPTKPYKDIQDAIDKADPLARTDGLKDTILVLPGTYDDGDDQELYFKYIDGQPKNLVLKSRDGAATTILDGETRRVFEIVDGTDTTLQIIGFTITASTGGENDGDGSVVKIHGQSYWSGNQEIITYSSATFKNCVIKDVDGEDTPIELYAGKAVFIDCEISGNTFDATNYGNDAFGGAITVGDPWGSGSGASTAHFYGSKLINNTITKSQAGSIHGGAIAIGGSNDNDVKLVNTIVAGNNVWYNNSDMGYSSTGGGIKFRGGKIELINSTIVDNQITTNTTPLSSGSAIQGEDWNQDGTAPQLTIFNSIIYGNTIVTNASSSPMTSHTDQVKFFDWNDDVDVYASYSLIGGDDDLGGDEILLNIDPDFADTTYVLHDRSPAIGAGETESEDVDGNVIYPPMNDLAGNVRPNPAGSNPDLGAYEHELAVTPYPAAVQNMTTTPLHRSVLLEWDFHVEEDVVSYVAYMSEDSITFSAVDTITGRFSTRTTIDSLTNTVPYWFYVTAVDTANYESAASLQQKTSPFFQGPVWIVTAQNSSSSGEGSPEDPMKNIRDAIEEAADGDTIMLMPGTYDHSRNRNLDFQYNNDVWQDGVKNLTLMSQYGADTTIIDLSVGSTFLDVKNGESYDSKIEGLTIQNGNVSSGGVINVSTENGVSAKLTINNCIFQNNTTGYRGAAIEISDINNMGMDADVLITNSMFFMNTASSSRAGAIEVTGGGADVEIINSIFQQNSSLEEGGAIDCEWNSNIQIINSLFMDNSTGINGGGAIHFQGGTIAIYNTIFSNNSSSAGGNDLEGSYNIVENCILQSESSIGFNLGNNFTFDPMLSSYFITEFSPAIGLGLNYYYDIFLDDDLYITDRINTDFLGNARVQPVDSRIDLGPIEHARWEQRRQVFYLATDGDDSNDGLTTSTPFATLSEAFNKSVIRDTIELTSGTYAGANNRDLNFGGVDRIIRSTDGAAATIIDCENQKQAFIFENGETDSTIISGITIQNGSAENGGAVDIDGADPIFDGVIFMDNSASTSGGAVYASNSNAEFVNCVFVGNHAAESGIMAASGGSVVVDFATAVGNKGDDDVSISGDVTITNSIFWGNSDIDDGISVTYSDVQGGAPGGNTGTGNYNGRPGFVDGFNGDFSLQDWSPVIGQANAATGVLYDIQGNVRSDSIPDMGAYENALDAAASYAQQSWYVSTTGSDSARSGMGTVQDPFGSIQFAMNHGIYDDEIHIAPGAYSESLNNWGKDLFIVGDVSPSDVAIDGYFEIIGGSPALYNLHLTNVNGTSDALQINNDAVVTMFNLLITNSNYAGVTVNNDAIATMYNLTIYGNATGIYENSTGSVSAVNSILWNNTVATYGTPTITYSDVEGSYTGTGNINSDPIFVDSANGDFNLQITSPCIDAGDSTSILDSDSTVTDMGAFPLIREFLAGTSTGNVDVTNDESAVITQDFTIVAGDTMTVEPGATVYFDPGVTMTVDGVLGASGVAGNPVSFESTDPDSSYGGVIINSGSGGGRDHNDSFYYMVIQDVGAAFIPLTINGDATIEHVTIAGNDNSTSLEVNSGTVDLNYSILEGSTSGSGTINETGSFTVSTDQFVSYSTNDFTLLSSAAAIDVDTTENWIDPDYTYADAGCFYHDQTGYISSSVVVLYPVFGDTISVSPDTSSAVGSGLSVEVQVFNSIGHYMTNPSILWGNAGQQFGTYASDNTYGANLSGKVTNTYFTTTTTNDLNSLTVDENGATAQSGYFKIVPGSPDSVWVNEQTDMTMTQLSSLVFEANIFDQFENLVADNETVTWNIVPVVGNGDGFTLDNSTASTQGGIVNVILSTDPTGNSLAVGDQVKVSATSGTGTHESAVITIIPDDIYNLTMPTELTEAQIDISADVATVYIEAALIDTFDNALEGVEINWEVVTGLGTGESLSASSTFTNVNGIAWVDLNTSTVSNSDYTVRGWVTENALFSVLMGTPQSGLNSASDTGIMLNQKSGNTKSDFMNISGASTLISLPVRISNNTPDENNLNRDDRSVYDLDDTTAVIHVLPGVTATVELPQDSVDVLLDDQFQIVGIAYDQYGNVVAEGTPVVWEIVPANNYVTIVNSNASITGGQATCDIQIEMNAPWDFDFVVNLSSESITGSTGTYNIDDVTAPDPISDLAINPNVWTSTNDFTLSWSNPYDHAGIFGAHVSIDGNGDSFTEEQNITSLSGLTLPSNALSTFDVWLEDNAGNDESGNAVSIIAKWDDTNPNAFTVTYPLVGWYNQQFLDFEWNASSDATAGLKYYEVTINSTNNYQQHPDSTQISIPDGFAEGAHQWTMTVYDSAGNATETSNPQTINIDFTDPVISHNPVLEGSDNSPASISASFDDPMSGIDVAELYYRKGGESQWQAPVDMKTLNTYVIASSFVTSVGVEYYIYSRDVAGNETYKPAEGHYSISVTIPGVGLSSTDRWPTGIPNGSAVSSYQFISFPGQAANATPTDILVDDLLVYDDTKWRFFTYSGGGWNEFATINTIDPGVGYFLIVKDAGFNITTGQTRSVTTDDDFTINFTSGEWVMLGNPFDFSIPLENVMIDDSTNLAGDPNFYTYDGANGWVSANKLDPWKGYVYKSTTANQLFIKPSKSSSGLKIVNPEIVLQENEWLIDISARNGLGVDKINTVGMLTAANDEYDALDAYEPPMLPGGISLRMDNRDWVQYGDTYTTDIRTVKEEGEFWDMEIAAEDDRHNVYIHFEGLADIPAEFDVFAIDVTLGVAQDLRWKPIYRYAVSNPKSIHDIRFIAGTKEFVQENNAGVELYPDRFSISQNYPNPFNPQTSILITLEDIASVDLIVYNLLGEEVIRISDRELYPAGYHNFIWKGLNRDGKRVASGVYFYMTRIRDMSGKTILNQTKKMIMVK